MQIPRLTKVVSLSDEERQLTAIDLAGAMLIEAQRLQTRPERENQAQLARMLNDPAGKAFTTSMTDQAFRSQSNRRAADQILYLLRKHGFPNYLSKSKQWGLRLFSYLGKWLPSIAVPLIKHLIRKETSAVILPGEPQQLVQHIRRRYQEGVRVNLNHLGEAILGEEEAKHRLSIYLEDLKKPEIEYISVKISTIYSQINLLAKEDTFAHLAERLRALYRTAAQERFTRLDGTQVPKFVNLDMEEYRDLYITVELFKKVLSEPEFLSHAAGIVLQSYLPDSFAIQQELTEWAKKRGTPIKIRIVKGANLAMEKVEASIRCWPQAPYATKAEVDANFKRMVLYGTEPENAKAVHLGIGSHNLFDIAFALLLVSEREIAPYVEFEMLEGMADHQRKVVQELAGGMLLYCPAASKADFQNAVAYLVRRLDENTAEENFLRHTFDITPDSQDWQRQAAFFAKACAEAHKVSALPNRTQNRQEMALTPLHYANFQNEPDTDWSLPHNVAWAMQLLQAKTYEPIPLVIDGQIITTEHKEQGTDPSKPGSVLYEYSLAQIEHIDRALDTAKQAPILNLSVEERSNLLVKIAEELRQHRGELITVMIADGGKTIPEADVEISEAIDFAEYYRRNLEQLHLMHDIAWSPKGTVLVAPPWNFPCSIPAGCVLAALAGGNSVLFKPAPEAILTGYMLAKFFWQAGVDQKSLQFIACRDEPEGSTLIADPRLNMIALTGGTATAKHFLRMRPDLDLLAETGGKNSLIISAMADRDLAIKDLVQSAFGHAGQKCSACSLAICEAEVYDDANFMKQLRDAAKSLRVGSAWNPATKIPPLIRPANPELLKGLTTLEAGESWLLRPQQDPNNPCLWTPGIKLGVNKDSFTYKNELFGPVLGVMRADNLEHALELANGTSYGLTAGLHSLDDREHAQWLDGIEAGNCYINRGTTGAIVQRQPFGGCKESSFGISVKAGGPNYVMMFMHPQQTSDPNLEKAKAPQSHSLENHARSLLNEKEYTTFLASVNSYDYFWTHHFSKPYDPCQLLGQDNIQSYKPRHNLIVRLQAKDNWLDILRVAAIAEICDLPLSISAETALPFSVPNGQIRIESESTFLARGPQRVRFLSEPSPSLLSELGKRACSVSFSPVLSNGRIEILHYLREQSVSFDYHRYGNLGTREDDQRLKGCGGSCPCS